MAKRRGNRVIEVQPKRTKDPQTADVTVTTIDTPKQRAEKTKADKVSAYITRHRTAVRSIETNESQQRNLEDEDGRFEDSDQWDANAKARREEADRPALTINRIRAFKRQIQNELRQAKPAMKVLPKDGTGNKETAEAFQAVIRDIESQSNADVAYDTAAGHMIGIGRGYVIGSFEYDEFDTFEKVIRLRRVLDPQTIYVDQASEEFDYADARRAYIKVRNPKDEYVERWGEEKYNSLVNFFQDDADKANWMPEGDVITCEVWEVVTQYIPTLRVQDKTGKVITLPASDEIRRELKKQGSRVLQQRDVPFKQVKRALINGAEILEGNEDLTDGEVMPGKRIPIFPMIGEETHRKGKRDYRGIVRDAKDPQRMYNFSVTYEAEAIAIQPKAPFIAADEQVAPYLSEWESMNQNPRPVLRYKPIKDINGQYLPAPIRQSPGVDLSAIALSVRQHDNDLKAVIGLFDASLGERGPEQSGKAINLRLQQGRVSSAHYQENYLRCVKSICKWLLSVIPQVYDTPRVLRLNGIEEEDPMLMAFHGGNVDQKVDDQGNLQRMSEDDLKTLYGVQQVFDLSEGRYDMVASYGPSHATRRTEALEALMAFVQNVPQAYGQIADIIAEFSDWPGAQKLVKRLRRLNPAMNDGEGQQMPPQVMAAFQQLSMQLQMTQQELAQANETIKAKLIEARTKKDIAELEAAVDLAIASGHNEASNSIARMQQAFSVLLEKLKLDNQEPAAEPAGVSA